MIIENLNELRIASLSVIENIPVINKHGKSKLSLMCLAGLDYELRMNGCDLDTYQKEVVIHFMNIGKQINNHHDDRFFEPDKYKSERKMLRTGSLKGDEFNYYYSTVRRLEKGRPNPWDLNHGASDLVSQTIDYREKVDIIYLAAVCSASSLGTINTFIDKDSLSFAENCPTWFRNMHYFLMAAQVWDDKFGWLGDVKKQRPSFFTSLLPQEIIEKNLIPDHDTTKKVFLILDKIMESYLDKALGTLPSNSSPVFALRILSKLTDLRNFDYFFKAQKWLGLNIMDQRHFES